MQTPDGWTIKRKPGLLLRMKARFAWIAYRKVEVPYRRLYRQFAALEAEREALLMASAARRSEGKPDDLEALGVQLLEFNERFAVLEEPWAKAEADMKAAYIAAMQILDEMGFEESSEQEARERVTDPARR